jgi:hypothetical protein
MSTVTTKDGTERYYPGAPHGITGTQRDQVNGDPSCRARCTLPRKERSS